MQRRIANIQASGSASNASHFGTLPNVSRLGAGGLSGRSSANPFSSQKGHRGRTARMSHPALLLVGLAALLFTVSWWLFPEKVLEAEHEAEVVGHRLAEGAIKAEHDVEDWLHHSSQGGGSPATPPQQQRPRRASSEEATARMLAQSSRWVDGEKALKKKLSELEQLQKKGELLGTPVLTRWLGEDFPAWVTPGMDEQKWRDDVAQKYKEMREEEEEWKRKMQAIIEQDKQQQEQKQNTATSR